MVDRPKRKKQVMMMMGNTQSMSMCTMAAWYRSGSTMAGCTCMCRMRSCMWVGRPEWLLGYMCREA